MVDASQYYNDPALEQSRTAATNAANVANEYTGAASTYPYKLKEAIQGKLDYNRDLIEQRNKAQENAFAAPAEARLQYQDIFNPFQREALVSRATAGAYTPLNNLNDILANRMGSISDIVGAGTAGFQSDVAAKQGAAATARQSYQDLLDLATLNTNLALDVEKMNRSSSDGLNLNSMYPGFQFNPMTGTWEKTGAGGGGDQGELVPPPMSTMIKGREVEYPPGSGLIWTSTGNGGWE